MPRIPRPSYRELLPFSAFILAALMVLILNSYDRPTASFVTAGLTTEASAQARAASGGPRESAHVNSASVAPDSAEAGEAYGKLPLSFVENVGQADRSVKFLARGPGYGLFLTSDEAVLALQRPSEKDGERATVRMKLLGASEAHEVSGSDELPGKNNYFVGDDPAKWRTAVPTYARVEYQGVYPGINLVYYGNQRQLEYDFVLAPGADPHTIALGFEGVDRLRLDEAGELVLHTAGGEVRQRRPVAYQETDGERREVAARYVLKGAREVGFEVGEYDAERPLVIDPVLVYSTYLGGISTDSGYGIAVNAAGQAFVTGSTASDNFPVSAAAAQKKRAFYPTPAGALYSDAFVTKLNAAGTAVAYSTFLGGSFGREIGKGIAVDSLGNAYVTGVTGGGAALSKGTNDFPVVNAYQTTFGGTDDAFVVKLNPTGSAILFSTYLGGNSTDSAERIAVNAATGEAYITGGANPATFPTTAGAYKPSSGCTSCINDLANAFVAKFTASGALDWATLVGQGTAYDIAIDAAGNSYITGVASNYLFPVTPGAFQTTNGGSDAFVTKLNPFGSALVYSTFLGGGPQSDRGFGIAVDPDGNAYVTGQTQNAAFPVTPGAFDVTYNNGEDAFVTKLNADGTALLYSTFLGGSLQDVGRAVAIDKARNVYVTGQTKSINFPVKNSIQPKTLGAEVFLTKLNAAGTALVYSTYLGTGEGRDVVYSDLYGAYLTGQAVQIPVTTNAFQTVENRGTESSYYDAFAMRVRSTNETAAVYSVGGKITDTTNVGFPSPGLVTMKLSGPQNRTTNLTAKNTYSFGALPPGTYTVTPSKPGFRFEPASRTFTSITASQVADFAVLPNAAPVPKITSPAAGETFTAPATITVTADASDADGSVTEVQFYANTLQGTTVVIGTDTTAPYSVTWTNVAGGSYVIGAIAKDDLGMKGYSEGVTGISVSNNVPATVELTSPAAGSTYKTGDFVTVNANVTVNGTTPVSYVDFFAGTEHVARDTAAPYGFSWRPMTAGTFALTARAVDIGGAVGTSPAVSITVNDTLSTFQGQITDGTTPLSDVTVTLSGAQTATVTTGADGKYSFPNLQAEGGYTVTPSKAGYTFDPPSASTDFMGYYDRTVNFRAVRNSSVSVMLTTPGFLWRYTAPAEVSMTAEASSAAGPITKVDFYANSPTAGKIFIGTDTTAPYSFVWSGVAVGDYGIQAVATDSTGDSKASESSLIMVEAAPAFVRINGQITDGSGTGMSGLRVTLSGTVNATAVTNLLGYYYFGNLPKGGNYTVTAPASYVWTTGASRTFTNLTVDQLDVDFETASFNSAPVVTLTAPAANATYTSPATIALSATASDKDGTVTRVQFYHRTATASFTLGTDTVAPYGFNWAVSTPGTYEIVAVATDNGGLRTTSTPVTITVTAGTTTASALNSGELSPAPNDWLASLLAPPPLFPSVFDAASAFPSERAAGQGRVEKANPSRAALAPYFGLAFAAMGDL
ncbi:MAG TPA: Ig-like domain-containing protein [Pyrinomonadaceae bacterium]|nr:Ig-like domain-containing protein [Pyrinomonadaceae bacterium]